jgi:DNA-binding transcriptional MerR regulator
VKKQNKQPRKNEALMPVGRTAEKAGVSKQSVQYYLMVGLLEPTSLTSSGRRMFDSAAVDRIKLINKLNQSGYPLRAIRELFMEREKTNKDSKK